ncbi:MAG TPA: hypothetical protein VLV88_13435 [Terriglobales bacterium]|nr:hypothetical protein [Terriglobales bacterium]
MPTVIPIDAHLLSLKVSSYRIEHVKVQVGRVTQVQARRVEDIQLIAPRLKEADLRQGLAVANQIWQPAKIQFTIRSITASEIAAPNNAEVVDDDGFFFLARQFPPKGAVSLLLVDKFKSKHLGGMSAEPLTAAIIPYLDNPSFGRILAHELGHLLGLPDLKTDHYNLMYQAYQAAYNLTPGQIATTHASRLAKQFGTVAK